MIYQRYLKRLLDICVAGSCLLLLAPITLICSIIIRLKLGTPVFFRQERPGLNRRIFTIMKFRTMLNTHDEQNNLLYDQRRLTRLGIFLRSTSLDEIPTLFNVLRGDMSLVGPRPLLKEYLIHYNDYQNQRHSVKPGITGWAQINGRNAISWEEKFNLDVWYIKNQSFSCDMRILWLTFWRVISRKNINHNENTTMPKFIGNETIINNP